MRTYGRVYDANGKYTWVVITTDAKGYNDDVYLTTLAQVFKGNLGESPFWGNYGLPAKPSLVTQVYPDYNVQFTQQQFAQYFTSLIIYRQTVTIKKRPSPVYTVNVVTKYGAKRIIQVAV